ncbi:MAG: hypothetical protein PWP57_65, partial [Candidatus Atribacteria bacterium]|nr:hypothetical protein [Candidatus Atribacteria bacterium]
MEESRIILSEKE